MRLLSLFILIALFSCKTSKPINAIHREQGQLYNSIADTLTKDTLIKFTAQPDKGFSFDYLIYLPEGLRLGSFVYLLVETTNTGANDSMAHHEDGARYAAGKNSVGNYVARKLKVPLLVPIFPRPATNWMYYTHALDRDALLSKGLKFDRLDLQLLAMIDDASYQLAQKTLFLKNKFFMTGFSASGTFANRFAILHPEKLRAVAAGGINAIAILPVAQLNGKRLNYPLGTADIKKITGKKVRLNTFRKLPQLLYMGAKDDNDAVAYDDGYSHEERALVFTLMGKQLISERWQTIQCVYEQNNVAAVFKTYADIGHGTDLRIKNELVDFFSKYTK